jgi:hypothetical protein
MEERFLDIWNKMSGKEKEVQGIELDRFIK